MLFVVDISGETFLSGRQGKRARRCRRRASSNSEAYLARRRVSIEPFNRGRRRGCSLAVVARAAEDARKGNEASETTHETGQSKCRGGGWIRREGALLWDAVDERAGTRVKWCVGLEGCDSHFI